MTLRIVLIVLACCALATAQESPSDFFPMEKGTRWTYSGKVDWTHDLNKVSSGNKTITAVVEDYFEKNGIKVALIRGGPWDLVWWEPNKKPELQIVVQKENTYYLLSENPELLKALHAGEWPKDQIEDSIWFESPLGEGSEFCGPDDQWRIRDHDTSYCWYVVEEGKAPLPAFGFANQLPWFNLRFQTLGSHEIDTLVPGIGITHFIFSHHGTVSNVDVKLVSFQRGTKRGIPDIEKSAPTSR